MYEYVIGQTLQEFPGTQNISDIIVFGSVQKSHDKNWDRTLLRLESNNSGHKCWDTWHNFSWNWLLAPLPPSNVEN